MNWTKLLSLVLLVAFASNATIAIAQPKTVVTDMSDAETLAKVAHERFLTKDFASSASLYHQAFAKSKNPTTLYNAGRAYEEAGNKTEAIATFKLYITLATDAEGVKNAKDRIAKLESTQVALTPVAKSVVVVQPPQPAKPASPVVIKTTSSVPNPAKSTVAAWVTTSGAAVAVGTGVALLLVGKAGTEQAVAEQNHSAWETARSEWVTGAVLTGVGVTLAGVSTYLWLNSKPVTVLPTSNGVVVGGNF